MAKKALKILLLENNVNVGSFLCLGLFHIVLPLLQFVIVIYVVYFMVKLFLNIFINLKSRLAGSILHEANYSVDILKISSCYSMVPSSIWEMFRISHILQFILRSPR